MKQAQVIKTYQLDKFFISKASQLAELLLRDEKGLNMSIKTILYFEDNSVLVVWQ